MQDLNFEIMVGIRVLAAVAFGFGIGLERELTNKYAGLRTHILVCLGSCIFTLLSIYAFPMAVDSSHPQAYGDPARIAAQILTGIGFIGGGTVLRHGSSVFGLTTAATLWVAASIGMACGAGMMYIGLLATLVSVGVLVFIRLFERNVLITSTKNTYKIRISLSVSPNKAENAYNFLIDNFSAIHEINKNQNDDNMTHINAIIDYNTKKPIQSIYKKFENLEGIISISIQDHNE